MSGKDNLNLCVQALRRFNSKFKPDTSTEMKGVIAALYLAQNDQIFKYTNMIGLLQLDMDRKLKSKFLRLYNIDTMKLAFEIEMYYDFASHYTKLDDKFYFFDYPVGTIGLLFNTKEDADVMLVKIRAQAPSKKQLEELFTQMRAKQKKEQQSNSLFGIFKKKFMNKEQKIEEKGEIMKFQKVSSIQMDANGRYMQSGKTPFEIDIIQKLQLSEKQKSNPQILDMITTNLIIHQIKKQMIDNPNKENKQLLDIIKDHQKQENDYLKQCRQTCMLKLPPPPPPPSILSPQNRISIKNNNRGNLMDEIKNNNLRLKHVQTNEKGGVNINLATMDTVDRDDFAAAMRRKIALRREALGKSNDSDDQ